MNFFFCFVLFVLILHTEYHNEVETNGSFDGMLFQALNTNQETPVSIANTWAEGRVNQRVIVD